MKSASVALALFAAAAVATPVNKRVYVTDVVVDVLTDYVTDIRPEPTHAGEFHEKPTSVAAATSVVVVTYESPVASPTPESISTPSPVAPVIPETSSAAAATTAAASASGDLVAPTNGNYNDLVMYHHNVHRDNHTVPRAVWDDDLAASAQVLAARCIYKHDTTVNGGGYGQNMACGNDAADIGKVISDQFYNGEILDFANQYGKANPDMTNFELWGHFTQIVWSASTKVGCATQHCPGGVSGVGSDVPPYLTFCNYGAPGNYGGQYDKNVLRPKGGPTITGASSSN